MEKKGKEEKRERGEIEDHSGNQAYGSRFQTSDISLYKHLGTGNELLTVTAEGFILTVICPAFNCYKCSSMRK